MLAVAALLYYYAQQELLLYGDAVAHLNIARRVVDNRHPLQFYGQLGTVWLPLQHIAMLPFVWVDTLWRSGIAGAVPGMVAFVLGALGIFRLVNARAGAFAGYTAAAIYALNPNLLYMQTTAMNEPIFLAFFIWSLVYLDAFLRATSPPLPAVNPAQLRPRRALEYCGICMAGGALTRYDGWFSAAIIGVILLGRFVAWWRRITDPRLRRAATKSFAEVVLLNALVPVYWLIYTWAVSGYALDFATGPYSAKAIAIRGAAAGAPPYPGQHSVLVAGLYFLKSAQLNVGSALFGRSLLIVVVLGTAIAVWQFRLFERNPGLENRETLRQAQGRPWGTLLLLWIPLAFYSLSIAYGSVPIYIPAWYPFSYYNVRYGLELLPVFAVFPVILVAYLAERARKRAVRIAAWMALDCPVHCQLFLSVCGSADHLARSSRQFPQPHCPGRRPGKPVGAIAALIDVADVRSRACRVAPHGGNSVTPCDLRSRASRLGVGPARPCASCRRRRRLPGRPGLGGSARS